MSDFSTNPAHQELMELVDSDPERGYPTRQYRTAMSVEPRARAMHSVGRIFPRLMIYLPWSYERIDGMTYPPDRKLAYKEYIRRRQAAFNHATCRTVFDAVLAESTITDIGVQAGRHARPQLEHLRQLLENPDKYRLCVVPDQQLEPILEVDVSTSIAFDMPDGPEALPDPGVYIEQYFTDARRSHEIWHPPGSDEYTRYWLGLTTLRQTIRPADYDHTHDLLDAAIADI